MRLKLIVIVFAITASISLIVNVRRIVPAAVATTGASAELAVTDCVQDRDCGAPLKCAFKKCLVECTTERDCSPKERCVLADRPFYVCMKPNKEDRKK